MTKNIAIIGSGFLGLMLALRLAEDAEEFECVCGLQYRIDEKFVTEIE